MTAVALPWDTAFWGTRICRAQSASDSTDGFACSYLLVNAHDTEEAVQAQNAGYRLMDVRLTFRANAYGAGMNCDMATPADTADLVRIARASHRDTRFYADPRFPNDRCDDLYEAWIRRDLRDMNVMVIRVDKPVGYVSVDNRLADAAVLSLIAVNEDHRGFGYGHMLVEAAKHVAWRTHPYIDVATSARNQPAVNMYQKNGFILITTELQFHRWQT